MADNNAPLCKKCGDDGTVPSSPPTRVAPARRDRSRSRMRGPETSTLLNPRSAVRLVSEPVSAAAASAVAATSAPRNEFLLFLASYCGHCKDFRPTVMQQLYGHCVRVAELDPRLTFAVRVIEYQADKRGYREWRSADGKTTVAARRADVDRLPAAGIPSGVAVIGGEGASVKMLLGSRDILKNLTPC